MRRKFGCALGWRVEDEVKADAVTELASLMGCFTARAAKVSAIC